MVWLWMFLAGIGVGPTFSVPTIVIQNAVPFRQLGVATSNLTFFRQIGGTIALAFVGHDLRDDVLGPARSADRRGRAFRRRPSRASSSAAALRPQPADRHGDMGGDPAAAVPPQAQALIPNIVEGIHGAFSLATAQTFWLGVVGAVVATVAALAIKEIPLRATNEAPVPTVAIDDAQAAKAPAAKPAASAD